MNCRYFNNKREFLKQMTMEEKHWEEVEEGVITNFTNYPPKTIQRFLWLSEYYWDEDKNEPMKYSMDRGLFISLILQLTNTEIIDSDLEFCAMKVDKWKYK